MVLPLLDPVLNIRQRWSRPHHCLLLREVKIFYEQSSNIPHRKVVFNIPLIKLLPVNIESPVFCFGPRHPCLSKGNIEREQDKPTETLLQLRTSNYIDENSPEHRREAPPYWSLHMWRREDLCKRPARTLTHTHTHTKLEHHSPKEHQIKATKATNNFLAVFVTGFAPGTVQLDLLLPFTLLQLHTGSPDEWQMSRGDPACSK